MALALFDRVQETTTTTGTGSVTLGGAVPGFQSFAVVGNGNTCYYTIVDGSAWEVGVGTYSTSGPTLARTTILSNSNGNTSAITLAAGTKSVFLTYPASKSVNLNESGNVSPLGTVSSGVWQGTTVGVAYGGTGVTASTGANSVVLRDASQNITINRINQGLLTTTASGGTTVLTAASAFNQALVGTGGHTYRLPDATTLSDTTAFQFNNNSTGTLTIQNNAGTSVGTIAPGGAAGIALLSNATVGGTWDVHAYIPENVTWGTNALALGSTVITGGTWNGGTIATGYGGTGLTSYTSGGAVYANSSTTLTSGTLPTSAGGTGNTTGQAASTASSATFNSGGAGGASGSTFNGSGALTVSYNTIGAPSVSGTNATGTWGISISGNAATATYATNAGNATTVSSITSGQVTTALGYTPDAVNFSRFAGDLNTLGVSNATSGVYNIGAGYTNGPGNTSLYGTLQTYWNGDISTQFWFSYNGDAYWRKSIGATYAGTTWRTILDSSTYNSYAPTLSGGGATGTWAINISGNAATATLATSAVTLTSTQSSWGTGVINNVIGMLAWKNYGNGHVIFDASAGTSPSGTSISNTNPQNNWTGTFPTLMGWNGANTYGVRVDSARVADSAGAVDYNALTNKGGGTGSYITSGDYRAPIFYDSNDTNYYVDPNSNSKLYYLQVLGSGVFDASTSLNVTNNAYIYGRAQIIVTGRIDNNNDGWALATPRNGILFNINNGGAQGAVGTTNFNLQYNLLTGQFGVMTAYNASAPSIYWSNANANTYLNGGLYAPIFYDIDNTAFYLDPGGNSYLNATYFDFAPSTVNFRITTGPGTFNIGDDDIVNLGTSASARSPIFYDYNNTAYYGDFASTSNIYNLTINGVIGDGTAPLRITPVSSSGSFQWASTAISASLGGGQTMLHILGNALNTGNSGYLGYRYVSSANGGNFVSLGFYGNDNLLRVYHSVYTEASGSMRSPIFYDLDNTAYYVDPAGTSNLNVVDVYGKLTAGFGVGRPASLNGSNWAARIGANDVYLVMNSLNESASYASAIQSMRTSDAATFPLFLNPNGSNVTINQNSSMGFPLGVNGIIYSNSDVRAPIFYDSADTGYYLNLNSTSNLYTAIFNSGATFYSDGSSRAMYIRGSGNIIQFCDTDGTFRWENVGRNGTYYVYKGYGTGAGFKWQIDDSGNQTFNGIVTFNTDARAPIYYDSNNTAYYFDPAGTSRQFSTFDIAADGSTGYVASRLYLRSHDNYRGAGVFMFGTGSSWFAGTPYTDFSGQYVISRIAAANDEAAANPAYKLFWVDSSGNASTTASMRSPIFYDSNDTTYYVNPNGVSNLSNLTVGNYIQTQAYPGVLITGNPSYNYNFLNGSWTSSITAGYLANCADQWEMAIHDSGERVVSALFFQGGPSNNYILMGRDIGWGTTYVQAQQSFRAPIFYDSNDTGYYVDPNGNSYINTLNAAFTNFRSHIDIYGPIYSYKGDTGYILQSFNQSASNAAQFNIRHSLGDTIIENTRGVTYVYGSYVQTNNSLRAPIFYDTNNTAYFCDPTSVSNFDGLTVNNSITGYVNGASFNNDSETQANITNRVTSGFWQYSAATTALGWPVNSGSWQHLLACTHSNDANYYSMQLAATFFDQGLFYRSTNGNGSTGWSRLVMYGNNYGSSIYGTIFYDSDNTAYYVDPAGGSRTGGINADSLYSYGNVTAYSDERLKTDWEVLPFDFVEKLAKVKSGTYTRIDSGERQVGVGAQSLQVILKEAVSEDQEYLGVNYGNAALASAVELAKYVTALEQRISQLEARL